MKQKEYIEQVEQIKQSLYRVAYSYMNDETKAIDILDEAIFKGYLNYRKLKKEEFFKTWLTRIVMNECITRLRKDKKLIFVDEIPEGFEERFDSLPLKLAMKTLPQGLFEIVSLRYFGGCTLAETADILKIPLQTVASREKKALSLLRIELSEEPSKTIGGV